MWCCLHWLYQRRLTCGDDVCHQAAGVAERVDSGPRVVRRRTIHVIGGDIVAHRIRRLNLRLAGVVRRRVCSHITIISVPDDETSISTIRGSQIKFGRAKIWLGNKCIPSIVVVVQLIAARWRLLLEH